MKELVFWEQSFDLPDTPGSFPAGSGTPAPPAGILDRSLRLQPANPGVLDIVNQVTDISESFLSKFKQ